MITRSDLDQAFGEGMSEAYFQAKCTAREVINLIKSGDTEEAILRLEREFWPKWNSATESQMAFQLAANDNQEAACQSA